MESKSILLKDGNLLVTGPRGVWVWDAKGNPLGTIDMPELPANLNWATKDDRTLYITATTTVHRLESPSTRKEDSGLGGLPGELKSGWFGATIATGLPAPEKTYELTP